MPGNVLLLVAILLLGGCSVGPPHPNALPLPSGGDAVAVLEESDELAHALPVYGTVKIVVEPGEGVDAESFAEVRGSLVNEISTCLRNNTPLVVVSASAYADLELKVVVNALEYVGFVRRVTGLALFTQAVLGTDLELNDIYNQKNIWKLRTYSVSRLGEGIIAASTPTQILGLCHEFSFQLRKGY